MTFRDEGVSDFLAIFRASKDKIRSFEGVRYLELLNDVKHANVFFTYSIWDNEEALEAYRNSELFRNTWSETKKLFSAAPEAWSTKSKHKLD